MYFLFQIPLDSQPLKAFASTYKTNLVVRNPGEERRNCLISVHILSSNLVFFYISHLWFSETACKQAAKLDSPPLSLSVGSLLTTSNSFPSWSWKWWTCIENKIMNWKKPKSFKSQCLCFHFCMGCGSWLYSLDSNSNAVLQDCICFDELGMFFWCSKFVSHGTDCLKRAFMYHGTVPGFSFVLNEWLKQEFLFFICLFRLLLF